MTMPFTLSLGLGAMLLLSASAAGAEEVARVKVPFAFVVHGQTLPAGWYDVRTVQADPSVVIVEGHKDARLRAMVLTIADNEPGRPGDPPALTFVRREGQYALSVIHETGDYGREILEP
jgi:hypothetical protein